MTRRRLDDDAPVQAVAPVIATIEAMSPNNVAVQAAAPIMLSNVAPV